MSAKILDGRIARDARISLLIKKIESISPTPVLAIIQVGDRADSNSYISSKKNFGNKIGVEVRHIKLSESISQDELLSEIKKLNSDNSVQGIIVQLPIPIHLNKEEVVNAIDPNKDVDALTQTSISNWLNNEDGALFPATARGVFELLEYYNFELKDKNVVVIGRSSLVGMPITALCINKGARVTVCHSKTEDLVAETQKADIIISAVGKAGLITSKHVHDGQIIIDVGINTIQGDKLDDEIPSKKLVGDIDFESVSGIVGAISPVPGGVGPMTVLGLFENLADLVSKK